MYKILIADDHPLFREAIHNVISDGFPGSDVMETADLDSALALTQEHDDLDLILLDLNMPGMHGLNGLINLPPDIIRTQKNPNQRRMNDAPGFAPELLQALTRKQLLVLERMTKGESNKQIAYTLEIAETTVKAHVSAILRKLNVHNRVQAILSAGDIDFGSYLRR
jgi:DNA-binding NarL/FixJ family response regulator